MLTKSESKLIKRNDQLRSWRLLHWIKTYAEITDTIFSLVARHLPITILIGVSIYFMMTGALEKGINVLLALIRK